MTFKTINKISIAIAMALICTTAFAASTIDRTIAKLNNDILTESDLAEIAADAAGELKVSQGSGFSGATSETVQSMLDRALLLQEARRLKITPDNEELHRQVEGMVRDIRANFSSETEFHHALASERMSLDQLKKELLEKTKTDYMVFHVISSRFSVSESEVSQYKDQQSSAGEMLQSFRLRRLGIPVKDSGGSDAASREARALVARIITEGISFEEGIRKYSQVPGAAADGGDMGYMSTDKLTPQVRAAVENLEVGQASVPVIAGGYANIFYLEGKRGAKSALRERRFFEAKEELLASLRRKAILQVFDDRLMRVFPEDYRRALSGTSTGQTASQRSTSGSTDTKPQNQSQYQQQYQQPAAPPQPTPQQRRLPWFGGRQ